MQIGSIKSGISCMHTTATGHGIYCAILGKYAKFAVTCRNHCNQKISQSLDTVEVKVYAPDGGQLKVEVVVKGDGVNQYSYYPSNTGTRYCTNGLVKPVP